MKQTAHTRDIEIHIYIYTHTYTYMYVHIHMHIHIHINIHPCIYAYTCKGIHTYKYIYMHTYTSTHTYTHIYMYIYSAYAHPVASMKQMWTLMLTTSVCKCSEYTKVSRQWMKDVFHSHKTCSRDCVSAPKWCNGSWQEVNTARGDYGQRGRVEREKMEARIR